MNGAVIIDVIAAAVLLAFLVTGARRGLFRSVAGLLIVVIALACAGLAAAKLTPKISAYLQPQIEQRVEKRIDAALSRQSAEAAQSASASQSAAASSGAAETSDGKKLPQILSWLASLFGFEPESAAGSSSASSSAQAPDVSAASSQAAAAPEPSLDVSQVLGLLGLDADPADSIAAKAQKQVRDAGVSAVTAVAESMAETVIRVLVFALSFAVLLLLLRLLVRAVDLMLELPGLHFLNRLGGAAFGILEGALLLFLAVWILRRLGLAFDTDTVGRTYLFRFFTTHTPLDVLSFL